MDFAVLHTLTVSGRKAHVIRARVEGAPDRTKPAEVEAALDTAGHLFGDAGTPWANHLTVPADKLPVGTREATAVVPAWSWDELVQARTKPQMVQVNIRLPRPLTVRLNAAAAAAGVPVREYVERVLTADLNPASPPIPEVAAAPAPAPATRKRRSRSTTATESAGTAPAAAQAGTAA